MIQYALRRILILFPTLIAVLTLTFAIVSLAPGSPFSSPKTLPPEVLAHLKTKYGLDQPRPVQFARYMARLAGFTYRADEGYSFHWVPDLGDSIRYKGRRVNEIIGEALPVSAVLGVTAYLIALMIGLSTGIAAALQPGTWVDRSTAVLTTIGVAIPSFVLGPALVVTFSLKLYWLPPARLDWLWDSNFIRIPTFQSLILPAFTLAAPYISYISLMTQSALRETLRQDYVRTARAKGLPEHRVVLVHGLRSALLPVAIFTGPALARMVTGTVVVEEIFAIPGLGHYFVDAANNRDYFLILGISAFGSIAMITANLLVDLLCAWIDPRIYYGAKP